MLFPKVASLAGRIAFFISIEAHKSAGGLHAHGQLHVQCIHQHTPLAELLDLLTRDGGRIVQDFLSYKKHVCRQDYEDVEGWRGRRRQTEEEWPEYKESRKLIYSFKSLLSISDPAAWRDVYLKDYVQPIQDMKQNHVHTLNAK